ncbi:Putative zinc-finger [Micromonospora pattaloongensis]|uniref:Zinc-finger n=1 Tax=Micromonospora pattaloongensis TaxID=405436 RepID=A0A1H3SDB6_9ACTN|nr:zf-HC2 domain-containing protein [Micromonospora pattaloongensis]SDZ35992.1 Putative zinc-finger [Micromonospora pattaloongensis]
MRCEHAHDDGAYVLGALSPAERAAYEHHLRGCAACRQAVAEVAVLPGLLGRLDPAGFEQLVDPPSAEPRLATVVAAAQLERRRSRRARRWRATGGGLAAAGLAVVVGLGVGLLRPPAPAPQTPPAVALASMAPVQTGAPVSAQIGLRGTSWGTEVTMHCFYAKNASWGGNAYTFRLVAHGPDGATEQVGSWVAAPGKDVRLSGTTRFSGADLVRLELTRYDGTPLLSYDVP